MSVGADAGSRARRFEAFLAEVEPRLRRALVATYGPVDGREATSDALSWAWEHWDRMAEVRHPVAYLYRVGQTAVRRFGSRPLPFDLLAQAAVEFPEISPELWPALSRLSSQQRTIVLLVHGFGWPQSEVAELLDVNPSTVREHLQRALVRLRTELVVPDAC
jgi:DNA-directed RNA polymerase specialized sigma24 family protein